MNDIDYALSFCSAGKPRFAPHPGSLLRQVLTERRMTQAALARQIGDSTNYVNQLVMGHVAISEAMCGTLAYALDLPVEFFFLAQQRWRYQQFLDGLRARLAEGRAA